MLSDNTRHKTALNEHSNCSRANGTTWRISALIALCAGFLLIGVVAVHGPGRLFATASAQSATDIEARISARSAEIAALEEEIRAYRTELEQIGANKATLQNEIKRIDLTRKKLAADIKVTEAQIGKASLTIEALTTDIGGKTISIERGREVVGELIRNVNELDGMSLAELALASGSISEFWSEADDIKKFTGRIDEEVRGLRTAREALQVDRAKLETERETLLAFERKVSDQKKIVDAEKKAKDTLLSRTKNRESEYRTLLAEKEALREKFERELRTLESELQIAIDPSRLPTKGAAILSYPVSPIRITQEFGDTNFARSGAYNGSGHNGIDLGAPVGTVVSAALSGTVAGVGDTDQIRGCYSYGKWVLITHDNGLSTLYAHLSLIRAQTGQRVNTGEIVGYSGNTGYSTGPHLHFTVYASQGVEIVRLGDIKKITNCANARIPVAPLPAYLNPLDYL